jgi:transposase
LVRRANEKGHVESGLETIICRRSEPSPAPALKPASLIPLPPSHIGCRLIRATRPTKRTYLRNTGQQWLALAYARWNWKHLIGNYACELVIAVILSKKGAALACQIREHLHLGMPGYANLFDRLFEAPTPLAIAAACDSPAKLVELGALGVSRHLRKKKIPHRSPSIEKVLAWAAQALNDPIKDGPMHHAIWTDLHELYQHFHTQVAALERELASDLVQTPYIRLLAIPGINVVSAAELAAEMGPITRYANANAITGRSGLYPSRHQSDQTDNDRGPLIRHANRRLRCVLMRIADNLACHYYYRAQAGLDDRRGIDKRASRVKIAKRFSRLALACVAGDEPMRHPCFQQPDSILEKLRRFHQDHETPVDRLLADLNAAVGQLPCNTRSYEAKIVAGVLQERTQRRRGASVASQAVGVLSRTALARRTLARISSGSAFQNMPWACSL